MFSLKATIRKKRGRQTRGLRKKGVLPAVLYGEAVKNLSLEIQEKEFEKIYQEAGESSLISLEADAKKYEVLIHQVAKDPLKGRFLHIDFYHPSTKKEVEAEIPLVFKGEPPAVKDLGGTLVKELQQVEVKGLARNLPREIEVDVTILKAFEDRVRIKDLTIPEGVSILKNKEEIVALVVPPEKEEVEKPVEEEKVEGEESGEEKKEQTINEQ